MLGYYSKTGELGGLVIFGPRERSGWAWVGLGLGFRSSIIFLDPVLVFDFHKDLFCNLMKV